MRLRTYWYDVSIALSLNAVASFASRLREEPGNQSGTRNTLQNDSHKRKAFSNVVDVHLRKGKTLKRTALSVVNAGIDAWTKLFIVETIGSFQGFVS